MINKAPHYLITFFSVFLFFAVITPVVVFAETEEIRDPIEPINRKIFWFNERFDNNIGEPAARAYDSVTPEFVQEGVGNFFKNLATPAYTVSALFQGKLTQSFEHLSRFVINSTLGVVGLVDVAQHFDLPHHKEDFGLMLTAWGIPAGPYVVIPILGPSNLRDTFGLALDAVSNPLFWTQALFDTSSKDSWLIGTGASTLLFLDTRVSLFDAVDSAKESSLDYYLFMQSAYYQHRRGLYYDGTPPELDDDNWADDDLELD